MKTSILLPSFKRPELLNLGLSSIQYNKPSIDFEIIVLNDGIEDETENVCKKYPDLNIKYIFTGKRNLDGAIKSRVPGFALNIGIKQATGEAIILSCPEVYHLNNAIDIIIYNLKNNRKCMVIPNSIYFDQKNTITKGLLEKGKFEHNTNKDLLVETKFDPLFGQMPYALGIMKQELIDIGGYDEDFTGYAGEDSDLIERLKKNGLTFKRTSAVVVHLYHAGTNDGTCHWDNPDWVHNWNLLQTRKDIIIRNLNKEWGQIK